MRRPAEDHKLIQIMDASFADAAQKAGAWLVCHAGCTQCCHGAFAIDALDAARLREGLAELQISDPPRAAAVEERSRRWIACHAADFPGDAQTGALGTSEEEEERFEEFANEEPCPALDPASGRCDLYAWRPMTCRLFGPPVAVEGGFACCELCFGGASEEEITACAMEVPHALEEELAQGLGAAVGTVVAFVLTHQG